MLMGISLSVQHSRPVVPVKDVINDSKERLYFMHSIGLLLATNRVL